MENNESFATFFSKASKGKKFGAVFSWIAAVVLLIAVFVPAYRVASLETVTQDIKNVLQKSLGIELPEETKNDTAQDDFSVLIGGKKMSVVSYLTKYDSVLTNAEKALRENPNASVAQAIQTAPKNHTGVILLVVFFLLLAATVVFALFTMNILSLVTTLCAAAELLLVFFLRFSAKLNAILTYTGESVLDSYAPSLQILLIVLLALAAILQIVGIVLTYVMHDDETEYVENGYEDVDVDRDKETGLFEDDTTGRETTEPASGAVLIQMNTGKRFSIPSTGEVILGKGSQANIIVPNPIISRVHAKIMGRNGVYTIQDLGSKNGTFVGDKKLAGNEVVMLNRDAYITLGNEIFQFQF